MYLQICYFLFNNHINNCELHGIITFTRALLKLRSVRILAKTEFYSHVSRDCKKKGCLQGCGQAMETGRDGEVPQRSATAEPLQLQAWRDKGHRKVRIFTPMPTEVWEGLSHCQKTWPPTGREPERNAASFPSSCGVCRPNPAKGRLPAERGWCRPQELVLGLRAAHTRAMRGPGERRQGSHWAHMRTLETAGQCVWREPVGLLG